MVYDLIQCKVDFEAHAGGRIDLVTASWGLQDWRFVGVARMEKHVVGDVVGLVYTHFLGYGLAEAGTADILG